MSDDKKARNLGEYAIDDPNEFAQNLARVIEQAGKAWSAYMEPREKGEIPLSNSDELAHIIRTLSQVGEYWLSDPKRAIEAQTRLWAGFMSLWTSSIHSLMGEPKAPVIEPDSSDKRFKDPEWSKNQFFDFCKQAYLIIARWADDMVVEATDLDEHTRHKASFYIKQIANALSPSNFVLTNPELLRETLSSNGENLVRGMNMLAEDIKAGGGELRLRQSDPTKFSVGVNLAITPGKVIHKNDICELIQYTPTTKKVFKRPLLIIPPWINKFYILDLNPQKSFIQWAVNQGHTVFIISWVNPNGRQAQKSFEHYMKEGIIESIDAIHKITGEESINAIGYCVGGTLLAITLAYCAKIGNQRINSATFFTTQVDFTHAGDLRVFVDEEQIQSLEQEMEENGYLEGKKMADVFNMLRSNDLIWPYVINNYLKGREPFPFDLLYWNSDSTHMPAANHSFYLRNCYLENNLSKKRLKIAGKTLDLTDITIPIYNLAARDDHIAPAKSVYIGSKLYGGPVRYVLAGSGHIAGVVNHPDKHKYQYWTNGSLDESYEEWQTSAIEHPGSWWIDWDEWIRSQDNTLVKARTPGGNMITPIEDAPGSYVKIQSNYRKNKDHNSHQKTQFEPA